MAYVNFIITGIFCIITIQTCHCMWKQLYVDEIKAVIWQLIDKPIEADLEVTPNIRNKVSDRAWNKWMCDAIQFIVSTLHDNLSLQWWRDISLADFVTWWNFLRLNVYAQSSCVKICMWFSSIGVKFLREVIKAPHIFSIGRTTSTLRGFTTFAYSTLAETNDCEQLTSFDMNSSFWVCNNLVTGHICNNKTLFAGDLVPSIFEIGSATRTLMPTLMGTVILWLTDNEG